jgi:hypothetical protein
VARVFNPCKRRKEAEKSDFADIFMLFARVENPCHNQIALFLKQPLKESAGMNEEPAVISWPRVSSSF